MRTADGSASIFGSEDGEFIVSHGAGIGDSNIIRFDDIYAVFQNELEVKVEYCPRVMSRRKSFLGIGTRSAKNPYQRMCKTARFTVSNDSESNQWKKYIKNKITPDYVIPLTNEGPHRRVLVIVNPIGGKRKGEEIYHEILKPMLTDMGTEHELIVTTGPGHANEIARNFDLRVIGAVAIVGGDGLFGEFLNGINQRDDRLAALSIPLGVVPAGSSNCIACSVGLRQPLAAAFAITRGKMKPMDVLKVTLAGEDFANPKPRVILSVCGVSYGFISEVNTHAGKWRRIFGPARYAVCGLRTVVASPMQYHVDCRYISPTDPDPIFDKTECGPDCVLCQRAGEEKRRSGLIDDPVSPMSPEPAYIRAVDASTRTASETIPVLNEWTDSVLTMEPRRRSLKPSAKTIDNSTMLLFSVTNLSIRQSQNWTVWNANCHMASGFMDLVLMPVMSRTKLLKFFNKFNKGGDLHKQDPNIFSVIKARSVEMRITNMDNFPEWEREIQIAIDGETYPLQPLRVDSLHGFLNFMCC